MRARFACLTAGNLQQRGGQQLGWESCCCFLPRLRGCHKKKYCQAFHGVRAKHELPLQPRNNCACFSLCGEFLFDWRTGIWETAHGSNHGRVANSHPNWWSQSCPAAAEREEGGKTPPILLRMIICAPFKPSKRCHKPGPQWQGGKHSGTFMPHLVALTPAPGTGQDVF